MAVRFRYKYKKTEFFRQLQDAIRPIEVAIHSAVTEAAKIAVSEGDQHVASKGFRKGFFSKVEPKEPSLHTVATIGHELGWMGIHEEGATISGKPLLWLPIEANLPPAGNQRWTPKRFVGRFGKLASARGAKPLLVGEVSGKMIPVFHGVKEVTIKKSVDFAGVVERVVSERLEELYFKNLKV